MEHEGGLQQAEKESLIKLLDILTAATEKISPDDQDSIQTITRDLIDHQALLAILKQQTDELDTLKKLSIHLTSSLDLPDVLDAVVLEAVRLIENARDVNIFLYKNHKLSFGSALDADGTRNKPWSKPRSNGLTYTVARSGEMIIIENMREHPLFQNVPAHWIGSIIGIPLKVGNTVVGVMNLSRSTIGGFTPSELRLLSLLSDQAAVAISNASLHQMISRQAYSDTLTGLPNRRALDERLEAEVISARRNNYSFAVIMMDLDGFKAVNDTYGHDVGDEVLKEFASRIRSTVRGADLACRYGGEEFVVVMPDTDIGVATMVAERIRRRVAGDLFPIHKGEKSIEVTISIGIAARSTPEDTAAMILKRADEALYRAKRDGRNRVVSDAA